MSQSLLEICHNFLQNLITTGRQIYLPALQSIIIIQRKKSTELKTLTHVCNTQYFKVQHTHTKSINQLIITIFFYVTLDYYTKTINIISYRPQLLNTKCIPHLNCARMRSKLALKFEIQSDFSSLTRLDTMKGYGSYLCLDDL